MSRKVYVEVVTRIIMDMDEGIEVHEVLSDMDYHFESETDGVDFLDTEIQDHTIVDSK